MEIYLMYITFPSMDKASEVAAKLLEDKLLACANILPQMTSIYRWEGKVCQENEVVGIFKTSKKYLDQARKAIIELHPYDCPCVLAWPVPEGHGDFMQWVNKQLG